MGIKPCDIYPIMDKTHFNEALIVLVKQRPALWNRGCPEHKNTKSVATNWAEVAHELNSTITTCMERWKNLRDSYSRLMRKINHSGRSAMGTNGVVRIKWPYFEQMKFINSNLSQRRVTRNITSHQDHTFEVDDLFEAEIVDSEEKAEEYVPIQGSLSGHSNPSTSDVELNMTPEVSQSSQGLRKGFKSYMADDGLSDDCNNSAGQISRMDNHLMTLSQTPANKADMRDPDECFLYSLLPGLRETSPHLKTDLKMNLLYLVDKYRQGIVPSRLLHFDK